MAHKKQTKRSHIKRCVKRVLGTMAILIVVACVVMVVYMALLEYGIIKLNPKDQARAEESTKSNVVDTTSIYKDVEMNVKATLDEQKCTTIVHKKQDETAEANEEIADSSARTQYTVGTIGEVDRENVRELEEILHLVPAELLSRFYNNGWIICVTDENIGKTYMNDNKQYNAAIVWGKKMIVVEDRSDAINGSIHEFGHYLDGINNRPSYSDEFHPIYLEETETFKANIVDEGCVHNQSEFFAQTFYYYILDPSKCTPKAYEYIETQLNILKGERSD